MVYAPLPTSDGFGYATAVAAWQPGNDPINVATIPLQPRPTPGTRIWAVGPSFVPGFDFNPQGGAATHVYNFLYWPYVDVVVALGAGMEFAIPAPGWINAAHLNGVQVLGTIFTYHSGAYNDFTERVLASTASIDFYAKQLASITQYYGFDGWFLDIEPNYPDHIQEFLTKLTNEVHDAVPNPAVIFYTPYDSSLDSSNVRYFQVVDALYLDYGWTEQSLQASARRAQALGRSPFELFAGVNVPAGGVQFDAWEQVRQASQAGVSAALWGTSWPFASAAPGDPGRDRLERFWLGPAEERTNPKSGIAAVLPARPLPATLPFCTSFNTGRGVMFYTASWDTSGQPVGHGPWSNMGLQDLLPTFWGAEVGKGNGATCFSWEIAEDTAAYDGGSTLFVSFKGDNVAGDYVAYDLFSTAFPAGKGLDVQMVTGCQDGLQLALGIVVEGSTRVTVLVPPCSGTSPFASVSLGPAYSIGTIVQPNDVTPGSQFESRVYSLPSSLEGATITKIFLLVYAPSASAASGSLGRIAIAASGQLTAAPGPVTNLKFAAGGWQTNSKGVACLNATLTWHPPADVAVRAYDVSWLNVNSTHYFLGRATAPVFVVSDLAYDSTSGSGSNEGAFVVQAIGFNGAVLATADSRQLQFTWIRTGGSTLEPSLARLPVLDEPKPFEPTA